MNSVIGRGVSLIPFPDQVSEPDMIAADTALEGTMVYDPEVTGSDHASQYRWVYIDRGTDDGVKAGMIFRHYQHHDPYNDDKITDADILPLADFKVVYATQHYSTARVLRGDQALDNGLAVVALTNLDDLKRFEAIKMKDLFGSAPMEAPEAPKGGKAQVTRPEQSAVKEPEQPANTQSAIEGPPPADVSPNAEAPAPEEPAPAEKGPEIVPLPAENVPPPSPPEPVPPPPEETAPPPAATDAKNSGDSLPPPPEMVAPMPDLPATPAN